MKSWKINEDVDSELRYWVGGLIFSLSLGGAFAILTGWFIFLGADAGGSTGARFLHDFWPYLVECAFWLGMLLGMLWQAGKRLGAALAGTLPWQTPPSPGVANARRCGQGAAFAALLGFTLALAQAIASAAGLEEANRALLSLLPLIGACGFAAAVLGVLALAGRRRR